MRFLLILALLFAPVMEWNPHHLLLNLKMLS